MRDTICNRTTQLLTIEVCFVLCIVALLAAGALHGGGSGNSKQSVMTRYQRGKASSIQAFRLADKDGDGKLTGDEVRALFDEQAAASQNDTEAGGTRVRRDGSSDPES